MNKICLLCLLVALSLVGSGCSVQLIEAPAPVPSALPVTAPMAVVEAAVTHMNAGELEEMLAYYDDDATVYFLGLPPTGTEVYRGKDAIRTIMADNVANHFSAKVDLVESSESVVTGTMTSWHDFTREIGVAPVTAYVIYEVENGKIVTEEWVVGEESLAQIKKAFLAMAPPEAAPETAAGTAAVAPLTSLTITIADGACNYDGPMILQAGNLDVTVNVKDQAQSLYALTLFTLDPGKDMLDLMVSTVQGGPPSWANTIFLREVGPGESETRTLWLREGPVYAVCWSQPPALAIGGVGPFEVQP
jgi:hypothetical protein